MASVIDEEFWVTGLDVHTNSRTLMRASRNGDEWALTGLVILAGDITSTTLKGLKLGLTSASMRFLEGGGKLQAEDLRQLTSRIEAAWTAAGGEVLPEWQATARPRLTRPDGTDPDGHARAVAVAYEESWRLGRAPGPTIAAEAGVPVATARGWIREARRRGHLAKGRKGRVG